MIAQRTIKKRAPSVGAAGRLSQISVKNPLPSSKAESPAARFVAVWVAGGCNVDTAQQYMSLFNSWHIGVMGYGLVSSKAFEDEQHKQNVSPALTPRNEQEDPSC